MQNRQDAIVDEPAVGFKVLQSDAVVVEDRSRAKLVQMLPQIKVSLLFQKQLVPKHFQRLNLKVPAHLKTFIFFLCNFFQRMHPTSRNANFSPQTFS